MFVVVSDIKVKPEAVDDFKKWFSEANQVVSKFDGFISRRLLETKDGQHRVLVEFESLENLAKCTKVQNMNNYTQRHLHLWTPPHRPSFTTLWPPNEIRLQRF